MCYQLSLNKMTIFINIAPFKNPKIRQRWPILLFENNHFLQGRPPKISYTHQQRPIKNPKIRQRWPILPFEKNHFVQGRPPKISYTHQHRPIFV